MIRVNKGIGKRNKVRSGIKIIKNNLNLVWGNNKVFSNNREERV